MRIYLAIEGVNVKIYFGTDFTGRIRKVIINFKIAKYELLWNINSFYRKIEQLANY